MIKRGEKWGSDPRQHPHAESDNVVWIVEPKKNKSNNWEKKTFFGEAEFFSPRNKRSGILFPPRPGIEMGNALFIFFVFLLMPIVFFSNQSNQRMICFTNQTSHRFTGNVRPNLLPSPCHRSWKLYTFEAWIDSLERRLFLAKTERSLSNVRDCVHTQRERETDKSVFFL